MSRFPGAGRFGGDDENPEENAEDSVDEAAEYDRSEPNPKQDLPVMGKLMETSTEEDKKLREAKEELETVEDQEDLKEVLEEHPILLDKYNMTLSVQNVHGFLRNINPSYIRARSEKAKTEAMQEANDRGVNWEVVLPVIVIVSFVFFIGYKIMFTGSSGGAGGSTAANAAGAAGASINLLAAKIKEKDFKELV